MPLIGQLIKLTPRLTFWIAVVYAWVITGIALAVGGGKGGPVAIAAYGVFLALLALDWFIYARARNLEGAVGVLYRPIVTATVGVAPAWIADSVLG